MIKEELGNGTFGSVYLADFNVPVEQRSIVIKKFKGESTESKRRFQKEAGILNSVKGHRNITRFFEILPRVSGDNDGIFVLRLPSSWCGKKGVGYA